MQRNLETFFPSLPSPASENGWLPSPSPPPTVPSIPSQPNSSNGSSVTMAVVATATSSFAFCSLLFFLFHFFVSRPRRRRREEEQEAAAAAARPAKSSSSRMQQLRSKVSLRRSVFVDEDGLDAVYWREFNEKRCEHCEKERSRFWLREEDEDGSSHGIGRRIQERSLLPKGFVDSSSEVFNDPSSFSAQANLPPLPPPPNRRFLAAQGRVVSSAQPASPWPPLPDPGSTRPPQAAAAANQPLPPPPGRVMPSVTKQSITRIGTPSPPPRPPAAPTTPPSPAAEKQPSDAPPPPPLPPVRNTMNAAPAPPPPPPPTAKPKPPPPQAPPAAPPPPPARPAAPPPPPGPPAAPPPPPGVRRTGGPAPPSRPPPAPASTAETGAKKLKPLHWDKVNAINVEHSMVWDKITNGSFKVDEDIMEALFGTAATNRNASNNPGEPSALKVAASSQITLLDPRKSQNIAIVLRRTAISHQAIIDGLAEGRGISADVLERLTKIALTKEEEDLIRDYAGEPSRLSDAESFLFHVLRAVPAPFSRFDAMLFRSNYEPEVAHLKQLLRTLEQACKELKTPTRGLFLKLLETVLKAGNRMNAGTARGNAQAFNLTALRKLADVKSTDGSTTFLHFVVEEVVRSEGKRLVVNRNHSLRRSDSGASGSKLDRAPSRSAAARAERENEYTMLGLPIVGGLSDEFANLKKAAGIDYDALITACPSLQARVTEIKRLVETTGYVGGGGFAREMRTFAEGAEEELRAARAEQARVLELVKSTTEYYHPGASNARDAHPMQLFVVVKDFLDMVDKACVDIAKNLQKKKQAAAVAARSSSGTQSESSSMEGSQGARRPMLRFPNLPPHFLSNNSKSDSSSDEDDGET